MGWNLEYSEPDGERPSFGTVASERATNAPVYCVVGHWGVS